MLTSLQRISAFRRQTDIVLEQRVDVGFAESLRGLRGAALDILGHSAGCKFDRELIVAPILSWGCCGSGCRP